MDKLLITNARLINENEIRDADVLIRGERIEQVGSGIAADDSMDIIDAAGRYLIPGMIDDQVHFREPGLTAKGDLATESAAAAAGGITSFMDMPNVNPQTTNLEALADKYRVAEGRCTANYGFYLGGTNTNIEEIRKLQVGNACGIKVFMGASTGDMLVDDPDTLDKLFEHSPVIVVTHCEDSPTIWENEARAREAYGEDVPMSLPDDSKRPMAEAHIDGILAEVRDTDGRYRLLNNAAAVFLGGTREELEGRLVTELGLDPEFVAQNLAVDRDILATGLGDFWRRWHISFSSWLRYSSVSASSCRLRQ